MWIYKFFHLSFQVKQTVLIKARAGIKMKWFRTLNQLYLLLWQVMCKDYIEKKRELLEAILKGKKLSNLSKIQLVFGIWIFLRSNYGLRLSRRERVSIGEGRERWRREKVEREGEGWNSHGPKRTYLIQRGRCNF